jgi:hypothetical protein
MTMHGPVNAKLIRVLVGVLGYEWLCVVLITRILGDAYCVIYIECIYYI